MRRVGFVLATVCLHAGLVFALSDPARFEPPRLGTSLVSVRLLAVADGAVTAQPSTGGAFGPTSEPPPPAAMPMAREARPATQPDNWMPSGRLTRLPVPLDPLDLDQSDAQTSGFHGRIELTLLVDRHGRVVQAFTDDRGPGAREFAERIAIRFRQARFTPGEVDGVAVNAMLKIAVVSERAASTDL